MQDLILGGGASTGLFLCDRLEILVLILYYRPLIPC